MKRVFIGVLLAAASGIAGAQCPSDRQVGIKEGHYGARTVRAYNLMISLQVRRRLEALQSMVEDGTAIRLPGGAMACLERDVATSSRSLVRVPGQEGLYWVHASALDR